MAAQLEAERAYDVKLRREKWYETERLYMEWEERFWAVTDTEYDRSE